MADPWGHKPRGGGNEGWHRLRAVPAARKPLWGQREPLVPLWGHQLLPVPVAQADPCPHGVAVTGACSGRGAWFPPHPLHPALLLLPPGHWTSGL